MQNGIVNLAPFWGCLKAGCSKSRPLIGVIQAELAVSPELCLRPALISVEIGLTPGDFAQGIPILPQRQLGRCVVYVHSIWVLDLCALEHVTPFEISMLHAYTVCSCNFV